MRKKTKIPELVVRSSRAQIARDTLEILRSGRYRSPAGRDRDIKLALAHAVANTVLYPPQEFPHVFSLRDERLSNGHAADGMRIEVVNATTFAAGRRLVVEEKKGDVLCLNFASAKKPGGGFQSGAQAQEECLARASGLFSCLEPRTEYYETNKRYRSSLYTDHMIYAPRVPVFRDDEDRLVETPWEVSILTAPAVNAGAVTENEPENVSRIQEVMLRRIEKILSVAVVQGHRTLVLGAWGCGVFRNDPHRVADWFAYHLIENETFRGAFETIVFAVLDHSREQATYRAFEKRFTF